MLWHPVLSSWFAPNAPRQFSSWFVHVPVRSAPSLSPLPPVSASLPQPSALEFSFPLLQFFFLTLNIQTLSQLFSFLNCLTASQDTLVLFRWNFGYRGNSQLMLFLLSLASRTNALKISFKWPKMSEIKILPALMYYPNMYLHLKEKMTLFNCWFLAQMLWCTTIYSKSLTAMVWLKNLYLLGQFYLNSSLL